MFTSYTAITNFKMKGENQYKQRTNNKKQNTPAPASASTPSKSAKGGKFNDVLVRLGSAILLIAIEVFIIAVGPIGIGLEVILIQFCAFYEFIRIIVNEQKKEPVQISGYINIMPYLLAALASYLTVGPFFLKSFAPTSDCTHTLLKYHHLICFLVGALILVIFVTNLTEENDNHALARLAWSILGCVALIASSNMYTYVASYSIFWFFTSISLIAWNDSFAYFCGRLFGRHGLIKLSPKKTVEGFVGALFFTVIIGWFTPIVFAKYPYTYCSNVTPFKFDMKCQIPKEFIKRSYDIFGNKIEAYPAQFHSLIMAVFASLVAPFGGFLASALKRAYKLKDFGNLIPGHGGLLDRCDCQFVMATFSYLYLTAFVRN